MGGHVPKPLGADGHEPGIDSGTLNRHASPLPGPIRAGASHAPFRRALVFDGEGLDRLFRSAAYSITLARHIKISPMRSDERDSVGVKAIIAIMPDAYLPHEIEFPSSTLLDRETATGANEFGDLFWQELDAHGVRGATAFLEDVEAQRENALAKVDDTFRRVSGQNSRAIETASHIKTTLSVVKCTSTIVVAGLSLPVTAALTGLAAGSSLAAFGVGTAYSAGLTVVKNWESASTADLVLVATEKAAVKTGQKGAKVVAKALQGAYESEAQTLNQAERKIEWLTKRIEKGGRARDARRLARAGDAAQAAKSAGRWAVGMKSVPYLFFAWSALDAVGTLRTELGP